MFSFDTLYYMAAFLIGFLLLISFGIKFIVFRSVYGKGKQSWNNYLDGQVLQKLYQLNRAKGKKRLL
jgi:hypothetical protein